jgi:uncharacterized protein (DUF1330 family)
MPAYVIFLVDKVRDPEKLAAYRANVRATLQGQNVTMRVLHGRQEMVEGAPTQDVGMLEFPTYEEAQDWYRSAAYQAVAPLRFAGADSRTLIVEGV